MADKQPLLTVEAVTGNITQAQADAIVVNLFEGVLSPGGGTGTIDSALGGALGELLRSSKAFTGKLGTTMVIPTFGKIPARHVVITGLGKSENLDGEAIRRASAAAIRACQELKLQTVATLLHGGGVGGYDISAAARLVTEGILLGNYQFLSRKALTDDTRPTLESVIIVENDGSKIGNIQEGVRIGSAVAHGVNRARDWVFDSPNNITPSFLKETAKMIPGLECTVLDFFKIKELGMGAFTLVAQGSDEPPFLIHLTYKPQGTPRKKVCLVGKGITFDSGGLSLKPPKSQETMKMDMAGAAAVLATMSVIAEVGELDVQVDAFIPTCENMPSGHAAKPGDIITAYNGKTIEVNNTDAEGRLILCDALAYAQDKVKPDEVIDLATLTGACVIALGQVAAGIMGTSDNLVPNLIAAGEHAGEKLWRLPLYEEYAEALKSDVADIINAGSKGKAGSSCAGMFLKEFIHDDLHWAHLDIAGPAYVDSDTPEVPKGATGFGVRTLLYYLYEM